MVTNWETHIAMCFIILFLKICGSCDIWNFVTTGYIEGRDILMYVCAFKSIMDKFWLLLVKMLGNIFCSVCVIANHWPSTQWQAQLQGREREGANYSGLVKIIKLNNGNASYYVNNNRGTFVVERNCFIKAAVTHAGNFANISRPRPWLHMAYCMR